MSRKKRKKDWASETDKLYDFLIELDITEDKVTRFSEYHIRIFGRRKVDVWAGSKKYYVLGSIGAKTYESLQELKEFII